MIKKGFSLIELLVTIAIMALIMGASLTAFDASKKTARDGKRKADVESLRSALEIYRSDKGSYPDNIALLVTDYISELPKDPTTKVVYVYTPSSCVLTACATYTITATLEIGGSYVSKNP